MNAPTDLELDYRGQTIKIPIIIERRGYTYRVKATIEGSVVYAEPDEEGQYRILSEQPENSGTKSPDTELLRQFLELLQLHL